MKGLLELSGDRLMECFSPASRIILIERLKSKNSYHLLIGFSPASRIILIESKEKHNQEIVVDGFQSRKQDYFN